jgi:Rrf2 family transcriptional regulator, nitric oxide-sensitive transcriptional repressor
MHITGANMRLTQFTDYALRLLMLVAIKTPNSVTIAEAAQAYNISHNHLTKIANALGRLGYLQTSRGRGGGLKLAVPAETIKIGYIIGVCEGKSPIVECFDPFTNTCAITPVCGLTHMLASAQAAFFNELDRWTLADLITRKAAFNAALQRGQGFTPG